MPLTHARATITLRSLTSSSTEITFSMTYEPRFGPIGWVMEAVMMKPMMTKIFGQVLEGLKHHLETDEIIPKDWLPGQPAGESSEGVRSAA